MAGCCTPSNSSYNYMMLVKRLISGISRLRRDCENLISAK